MSLKRLKVMRKNKQNRKEKSLQLNSKAWNQKGL